MAVSRRTPWVVAIAGVAAVLVVAAVVIVVLLRRDDVTAVPVSDAVDQFRQGASTTAAAPITSPFVPATTSPVPVTTAVPTHAPDAGVYVYDTSGTESVDALGGTRHTYPAQTAMTVTQQGCGVLVRWTPLEGRSEEWPLCVGADGGAGVSSAAYTSSHRFFNNDDVGRYTCPPDSWLLPPDAAPGATWSFACQNGGVTETWSYRLVGPEPVTVGGAAVAAVRLRADAVSEGQDGSSGTQGVDQWLDPGTGLPLHLVRQSDSTQKSAIGDVHYQERVELTLTSLTPRR